MRKYFKIMAVLIIAMVASHLADAQWYVTGSVSSHHSSRTQSYDYSYADTSYRRSDLYKSHQWTFSPELGYYFKPNMAVGSGLSFNTSKSKSTSDWSDESVYRSFRLSLSPFFRWDFVTTDHLAVGVRAMAPIAWEHPENKDDQKSNYWSIALSLEPVLSYKFNDHWGAVAYLGYLSMEHVFDKYSAPSLNSNTGEITYIERKYKTNNLSTKLSMENWRFGVVYTF